MLKKILSVHGLLGVLLGMDSAVLAANTGGGIAPTILTEMCLASPFHCPIQLLANAQASEATGLLTELQKVPIFGCIPEVPRLDERVIDPDLGTGISDQPCKFD